MDFSPVTPKLVQPIDRGHVVFGKEVLTVGSIFGHMDVAADTGFLAMTNALLEVSSDRVKRGVQSHHGSNLSIAFADLLDEALVFRHPAAS